MIELENSLLDEGDVCFDYFVERRFNGCNRVVGEREGSIWSDRRKLF